MFAGRQQELLVSGPTADANISQATILSSGAALTLIVWDALLTLGDEVDHIWSKPSRTYVKWIYLFSRWFGLVNQIGTQIWYVCITASFPVALSTCKTFYILESVTFLLLQICLDAILILRIWAIYQRNRRYIATAIVLVFIEILMMIMTQALVVPKSAVDGACTMLNTPAATSCIGIAIMVSQSVLLFLTYRGKLLMQPAARRSKVITVVVRDGIFLFGLVIAVMFISLLYLLFNQVVVNIFLPWMPVVPSLLTPRMILNMQMAAEPAESMLEFTTRLGPISNNETQPATAWEEVVIYEQDTRDSS